MKHLCILLVLGGWSTALIAQTVSPQVISSSGREMTLSAVSISWTLGEAVTGSMTTAGADVANGFQQGWLEIFSSHDELQDVSSMLVYPNPVTHLLRVIPSSQFAEFGWEIRLYGPGGDLLQSRNMTRDESVLDLGSYAAGVYLLKISNNKGKSETYHIIKPSEHEEF